MTIKFVSVPNPDGTKTDKAAECMNKLVTLMGGTGSMTTVLKENYCISGTISLWGKTYKIGNICTYGMDSRTIITAAYDDAQQVAVFYDSSRAPNTQYDINSNSNQAYYYYFLILTPSGVHIPVSRTAVVSPTTCFNIGGGNPQPASTTLRANLTPLAVWGQDASPVFISSNLVMDTAGTIVTDTAGTKFVSLGNLLYIRETADANTKGTAVTCRVGTVTTLPTGSQATVKNVGTLNDVLLDFGIPQGPQGPAGPQGDATKAYVDKAIADAIAKLKTDNSLK